MQQRSLFGPGSPAEQPATQPEKKEPDHRIYTVSELNSEFKFLLESTYSSVWLEGEISNFNHHTSGHFYFSLKDDRSQIKAVMWKSSHRFMKWRPKDGMKVIAQGRITLYEPNGQYQIDIVQMIPHGKGELYAAFEQLKEKLQKEGLFDPKRKRPIPMLPKKIGIVTSPTGAVIRDILNILSRRYLNLHLLIFPAKVQGEDAAPTIVEGLRALNRFQDIDVLIVARGGGSLEDLWPFNEESVARAIAASRIPVISAVGHETDTTIADFVADLRAPTPSAAAELVIGKKSEFVVKLSNCSSRMLSSMRARALNLRQSVHMLAQNRAFTGLPQKIHAFQQKVDDLESRLLQGLRKDHQIQNRKLFQAQQKLNAGQLRHLIEVKRSRINLLLGKVKGNLDSRTSAGHRDLARLAGKLDSLSPLAVLERGYSIASTPEGSILKDSAQAVAGQQIRVRLHHGKLKCEVREVEHE